MIKENGDEGGVVGVKPKLAVHTNYKAFYSENNSATHQRDSLSTKPLNTNELGERLANELVDGKDKSTEPKPANGVHEDNKEPDSKANGENPVAAGENSTSQMPKTLKPSIFFREASREHQEATATIKSPKTIGSTPIIPDLAKHQQEYAHQREDEEKKAPEGGAKGLAHHKTHLHDPMVGGSTGNMEQMAQRKSPAFNEHPFRHLIFNPHTDEISFRKHLVMTYKGLLYATKCLKGPSDKFIKAKQVDLQIPPNNVRPKTLVLDLDETMSHTCSVKDRPDLVLYTNDDEGNSVSIPLKIRPYLNEFLKSMSLLYEIIVFTAGADYYANAIINYLDPTKELISDMLTRQNCMETKNGFVIKDLRIIRNRELKNIVMVDNLAHSFGLQIDNGIPILEFIDNPYDKELKYLAEYLTHLAEVDDVRDHIRSKIRLRELAVVDEERLFDFKKDS